MCLLECNPEVLLHPFMSVLAAHGLGFQQALLVPPESGYCELGSSIKTCLSLQLMHKLQCCVPAGA